LFVAKEKGATPRLASREPTFVFEEIDGVRKVSEDAFVVIIIVTSLALLCLAIWLLLHK
jgi:hypothetical protein